MATKAQKRKRVLRDYIASLPKDDLSDYMHAPMSDAEFSALLPKYVPDCAPAKVCLFVTTAQRCAHLLVHGIVPRRRAAPTRMFATWQDLISTELVELLDDEAEDPVLLLVDTNDLELDYNSMFDVLYDKSIPACRVQLFESDWLQWETAKPRFLAAGGLENRIRFKRVE